jgi:predicted nucleic acid-binding protein
MRERVQDWLTGVTRFVIDAGVGLYLVAEGVEVNPNHELLAPTLFRSQTLSLARESVVRGEIPATVALEQLERLWQLKIRLLGDAVLRRLAWKIADQLGWVSTYDAEYLALTQLQGDAFVTRDPDLARRVEGFVAVAPVDDLR